MKISWSFIERKKSVQTAGVCVCARSVIAALCRRILHYSVSAIFLCPRVHAVGVSSSNAIEAKTHYCLFFFPPSENFVKLICYSESQVFILRLRDSS